MLDQQHLAQALSRVLWIAGSPCSGKSTISHTIARIYVFIDYHADAWESNHFNRRGAAGDAEAEAFLKMSMNQRWIERSVEVLPKTQGRTPPRKQPWVLGRTISILSDTCTYMREASFCESELFHFFHITSFSLFLQPWLLGRTLPMRTVSLRFVW
jgi:hypothetical protein